MLLFILLGFIMFGIYDIERSGTGGSRSAASGDRRGGVLADEGRPNTPRNERDVQKARREGTLRDGE